MIKTALLITLFSIPSFVSSQVVINEIAWMGVPIEGVDQRQWWRYEWIVPQKVLNITLYS